MPSDHAVKVVYKGADSNEFFVIANADMVTKWKSDKTVPLVDVVQSFDVFTTTNKSNTGEYISPSKGLLESTFNTTNVDDIVKKILSEGEDKGL
ncbi:ribosome maturation protein [Gilbertella persicaria]|uniref:Ribosome maturation protein SDO1/SBDS N-terminal domain-containing protein n=1 Tax=Rhizopus stolonifer TaxID=4846 RepID=A0A367KWC5_RHIST|nr:ribosome maturation protein [Gilbertella persicaria]KAI8092192.1 ribosome maturation protein [Gilbertella persicaria]RCI06495.1 hypothetical protein CU098_005388 [Rhizopus stolonifer]